MDNALNPDEKRDRYRLNDKVSFDFIVIPENEDMTLKALVTHFLSNENQQVYWLEKSFFELENEHHNINALVSQVSSPEKQLFHYLNDKINLLYQFHFKQSSVAEKVVNLSLSGMAFSSNQPLRTHDKIGLMLHLLPHYSPEFIKAKVIYCAQQDDKTFKIAVEFQTLDEVSEKRLNQHLLLKQSEKNSLT